MVGSQCGVKIFTQEYVEKKKIKNHLLKNHSARKSETNVEAQVVQIKFCLHHSMEKEWGHKGG